MLNTYDSCLNGQDCSNLLLKMNLLIFQNLLLTRFTSNLFRNISLICKQFIQLNLGFLQNHFFKLYISSYSYSKDGDYHYYHLMHLGILYFFIFIMIGIASLISLAFIIINQQSFLNIWILSYSKQFHISELVQVLYFDSSILFIQQ